MDKIEKILFENRDEKYREFHSSLVPNIDGQKIIGVRMPTLRKIAKSLEKDASFSNEDKNAFLCNLPHEYYEENILHSIMLSDEKDFDIAIEKVEVFLPYIDNWAVCDCLSPKVFAGHKPELMENIRKWAKSEHVYTCRFGLEMLMTHFLDGDFRPEYLELPASVKLEDYYAKMMVAWFFATALAKQWDAAVVYLEQNRLEPWTHNKTIQKARESYRISAEQKEYLKTLK